MEPVPGTEGALIAETLKIPHTYCWSPALVPKPNDWPTHVGKLSFQLPSNTLTTLDVCGFFFRDDAPYTPPEDLQAFLKAGPTPIYIGFGSIVIDNPENLTNLLLEVVQALGVRAIISKGWSNLGSNLSNPNIFFLGDCPHEWLFQQVSVVVHHGGAGTTACGLKFGRPTAIIPFFGDQPFWGEMISASGAGSRPISYKLLTSQNLTDAIKFCLSLEAKEAAGNIATRLQVENGVRAAANSFHKNLPLERLPCDILPNLPAVWRYSKSKIKLSSVAVEILVKHRRIEREDLKLYVSPSC